MNHDVTHIVDLLENILMLEKGDLARFMRLYDEETHLAISDIGAVLRFLELAQLDGESSLGWAPTERFKQLTAGGSSENPSKFHRYDILQLVIVGCLFGNSRVHHAGPAWDLLERLGLCKTDQKADECKFSEELIELFEKGYRRWLQTQPNRDKIQR